MRTVPGVSWRHRRSFLCVRELRGSLSSGSVQEAPRIFPLYQETSAPMRFMRSLSVFEAQGKHRWSFLCIRELQCSVLEVLGRRLGGMRPLPVSEAFERRRGIFPLYRVKAASVLEVPGRCQGGVPSCFRNTHRHAASVLPARREYRRAASTRMREPHTSQESQGSV